jgi:hypothetical protein
MKTRPYADETHWFVVYIYCRVAFAHSVSYPIEFVNNKSLTNRVVHPIFLKIREKKAFLYTAVTKLAHFKKYYKAKLVILRYIAYIFGFV